MTERFRRLFDDLPSWVAVMDPDLNVTAGNRKFREDFSDAEGKPCWETLRQADEPCAECPVRATFVSGESNEGDAEIVTSDGRRHDVLVWTAPVRGPGDEIGHVMAMYTGMAQLQKVHDHLSSLGLMVGSISHSIKGMLTGLDGGMYLVDSGLRKDDGEQVAEGLKVVRQMIGRIRSMVLDVLLFSKDRGMKIDSLETAEFCGRLSKVIQPLADEKGIEFVCIHNEAADCFCADEELLQTALTNILENAVEACAEGPGQGKPPGDPGNFGTRGGNSLYHNRQRRRHGRRDPAAGIRHVLFM